MRVLLAFVLLIGISATSTFAGSLEDEPVNKVFGLKFGPCQGPGTSKPDPFYTQIEGNVTLETDTLAWWPIYRPEDVFVADVKTTNMTVTCGPTGDFHYSCGFYKITCETNLNAIYKMCSSGVFEACHNVTTAR